MNIYDFTAAFIAEFLRQNPERRGGQVRAEFGVDTASVGFQEIRFEVRPIPARVGSAYRIERNGRAVEVFDNGRGAFFSHPAAYRRIAGELFADA